jgi:hypothetical protein
MMRVRMRSLRAAALATALWAAGGAAAAAETLVQEFRDDPFVDHGDGTPVLERRGPQEAFEFEPATPPAFYGDAPGSLLARYDSLQPTARAFALLSRPLDREADFEIAAVFVIRSQGFAADPSGFAQVAFGLMNRATTGDDRTGELDDFRADTFDTLEFDYFPNVSPFFGGPFAGGSAFGGAAGDDAFLNFTFASVELALPLDEPLEARLAHRAGADEVEVSVARVLADATRAPLLSRPVLLRTALLAPGLTLDAFGIFAYHDGFNEFAESGRSLRADVEYHRLEARFVAPIPVSVRISPDPLSALMQGRFVRARLAPAIAAAAPALRALAGEAPPIDLWLGTRRLASALRAEYDVREGELVVFFDAGEVLAGARPIRGEAEIQVRGEVEGSGRVFILGTALGSGGSPGHRRHT